MIGISNVNEVQLSPLQRLEHRPGTWGGPHPTSQKERRKQERERETGNPHLNKTPSVPTKPALIPPLSRHFLFTQAHIRGATKTTPPPQPPPRSPGYIHTYFFFTGMKNITVVCLHFIFHCCLCIRRSLLATCCFISPNGLS